ncbi:MAG: porin [Planctomycetales bacterium]|nr:porin [Planctomycetales bacterium]MCB1522410.1 porin [Hyphomicrobiaceae bacterium]
MRASIGFAAVAAVLLGSSPALAADLGGDCCADLEERIAELEATTARKGNRKVSLTVYGQVNQAVMFWDDQTERNTYVVNNKSSTTYFGFEGRATINPEWSAGYLIEIETGSANSDFVDQGVVPGNPVLGVADDFNRIIVRHSNWWIESKRLGRITIGQQSSATDNIAEMDLSRTSAVSLSSVESWNEGFFLRDANTGVAVIFPGILAQARVNAGLAPFSIVGDLWRGNLDGGRGNFVRYDTPVVGGFIASASWGEDDDWDVGLRYGGSFNGVSLRAGIGYHYGQILDTDNLTALVGGENILPEHESFVGSASMLHEPTGLFVTVAGGMRNWLEQQVAGVDINSEKYFYVKSGLLRKWNALGQTAIYGEYYRIWDVGISFQNPAFAVFNPLFNEEAETYGVGIVQHIDAAAMELYLSYRHYTADNISDFTLAPLGAVINDHDIRYDIIMAGGRIKF